MTTYTRSEQRLIARVLKETVERRLKCTNGRCLLGVQSLANAIVQDKRMRRAGVTRRGSVSRTVLDMLRKSNLILSEWGHSSTPTKAMKTETLLIFSVEGVKNDGDQGDLSTSFNANLHFEWPWALSPKKEMEEQVNESTSG